MRLCCFSAFIILFLHLNSCSAEVLFRDNFQAGKSELWKQRNDGPRPGRFQAAAGSYSITSDDPAVSLPRALISENAQSNYFLQADVIVQPISRSYATASLISYYTDSNHYYEFSVDRLRLYWSLRKNDKSGQTLLAHGDVMEQAARMRMGLYCRDGELRAFLNENMVAQVNDQRPLPGGAFGISARGSETRWDNVVLKQSNPDEFHYNIISKRTNARGLASFAGINLAVTFEAGPVAGVEIFRIEKDSLSYFIFFDPLKRFNTQSGFRSEFHTANGRDYQVTMERASSALIQRRHHYSAEESDWLLAFLSRSARFQGDKASADIRVFRRIHLRSGQLEDENGIALNDTVFGTSGKQTEIIAALFGEWDEFGNYNSFPSITGRISSAHSAVNALSDILTVPLNSEFTLYRVQLSTGGSTVPVSWLVQEDARPMLVTERAELPSQLRPSGSYTIPFTIFNSGEAAGRFFVSIFLSADATVGPRDKRLARRAFDGIAAGARISSELDVTIPANTASGRYFLAVIIETENRRERIVRINNSAATRPVTIGDFPANGQLDASLVWDGDADLDLHLSDPYGEKVYYFHPVNKTGGRLANDVTCVDRSSGTEQIVYQSGTAPSGIYTISIHHFSSCGRSGDVRWTLTVRSDSRVETFTGIIRPGQYLRAADFKR